MLIYCDHCKKDLLKYGAHLFEFFEYITEQYIYALPLEVSTDNSESTYDYLTLIRFLELKKYIVTTESAINTIQVKPRGVYNKLSHMPMICFCTPKLIYKPSK